METSVQKTDHSPSENEDSFRYEILTGHHRTDGSYKNERELRMQYIQLTDELIHKMTDGLDVINPDTGEKELKIPDVVIFLDKSARPLSWLTRDLWDTLAQDPISGEIPQKPDFKFLNIDRNQWVNTVDPDGQGTMNVDLVDDGVVRSLRSIFVNTKDKINGLTDDIDTAPSVLDNKTIMVVDEVYSSGRTLDIATKLVRRAFPTAHVGGTHWMAELTTKGLATGNNDLPVWYSDKHAWGRGIGDRMTGGGKDKPSTNVTQKFGSWFLSTRLPEPDTKALQLRAEFKQLAHHPDVPLRTSIERIDALERMERLNGMPFSEIKAEIEEIKGKKLGA